MFDKHTDSEWEKFGQIDPYFGVLTDPRFSRDNLSEEHLEAFFETGAQHVENILYKIRKYVEPEFSSKRALDFGCGVGRLVIPLSRTIDDVTGLDVSDSMLAEATKNCRARSIENVTLEKSDDQLTALNGEYDLIHSYIVFQHIPPVRGEAIFKKLIAHLAMGGVGVMHFTYAHGYALRKLSALAKLYVPLITNFHNLLRGKKPNYPQMEMNPYDLNRLFRHVQDGGAENCHIEFSDHGGELGVIIYFRKPHLKVADG